MYLPFSCIGDCADVKELHSSNSIVVRARHMQEEDQQTRGFEVQNRKGTCGCFSQILAQDWEASVPGVPHGARSDRL